LRPSASASFVTLFKAAYLLRPASPTLAPFCISSIFPSL